MLLPFNWLKEFIKIRKSPGEIADMLTMAGLEVESSEGSGDDTVFDIDLTPNRGDCLSVLGTARELAAVTGKNIKIPRFRLPSEDKRSWIRVSIGDRDLCARYAGRVLKGIKVEESPAWLKKRLELSGIRSINNIVDVTNYVMLEYGQPLHAFDFGKLVSGQICVSTPDKSIRFTTLDGIERLITGDMLLIWDGNKPVAIAGVMGGLESEVGEDTTGIFLESACFNPSSVRRTSSELGLKSESSFRFERGIDVLNVDKALDRASFLISELAGGVLCKRVDVFPRKYRPRQVKLEYAKVNNILGVNLSGTKIQDLISRIGARVEDFDDYLHVEVPSYRNDIENDFDLIEEVARLYGYHRIASSAPVIRVDALPKSKVRENIKSIRNHMCSRGYSEVINFSFMNPDMIRLLNLDSDDPRNNAVRILNPLRQEESLVRTTLVPSLLENLGYNFNRGIRTVKLFEISKVFIDKRQKSDKLPGESMRLGGAYLVDRTHRLWKDNVDDFFVVKGDIDAMIKKLTIGNGLWKRSSEPFLHPGRSADFILGNRKAGFTGILSPDVLHLLDMKVHNSDVVLFEFDLDIITVNKDRKHVYKQFSRFPFIQRDISVLVDPEWSAQDILELVKSYKSKLIDEVTVFDYYSGKNIPDGKISLGFNVHYRAYDRTLSDEEIDGVHNDLIGFLLKKSGAQLRQ